MPRKRTTSLFRTVASISHRAVNSPDAGFSALQRALAGLGDRLRNAARVIPGAWERFRGSVDVLALPVIRQYAAWFGKQAGHVQVALITLSLALAFLLALAAGRLGLTPPAVHEAKAQAETLDLAGALYGWADQQPAVTEVKCGPFETQAACQRRLATDAEQYEDRFGDYVRQVRDEQQWAVWKRKGDAFPKYNADTGELVFTFALEGKAQGDAKYCTPLRVIAKMPEGVHAGIWPDQGDAKTKIKPFAHPCLRAPEWTAVVRVDTETAKIWDERAKADGWRLEMFFRLENWESPLHPDWDEDARLRGEDLLAERRLWLWVDEVQLVIGDLVVQRWRETPW